MIYLLLFYKPSHSFILGHALVHLWSLVDASFRWYASFVLCLLAQTFLGLLGEAASLHIVILLGLSWLAYFLLGLFILTRVHFQNLGLSEKSWLFHFVLEGLPFDFFYVQLFRRTPKLLLNFLSISVQADEVIPLSLIVGPHSCFWVSGVRPLVWWCSYELLVPYYPCTTGDPKFLEVLFRNWERCPGESSPCILFSPFCDR